MINLISEKVFDFNGNIFEIVQQDEKFIYLKNGKSFDFFIAFTKGFLKAENKDIQQKIENEILNFIQSKNDEMKLQRKEDLQEKVQKSAKLDKIYVDMKQDFATTVHSVSEGLFIGNAYGMVAKEIYEAGCSAFGWDWSRAGSFAKRRILFARNATPEGFAVWILPNSNLNDSVSKKWVNEFSSDFETVKEKWNDVTNDFFEIEKRVTFVKQSNGIYMYVGIYQVVDADIDPYTKIGYKIYKRIGGDYPEK